MTHACPPGGEPVLRTPDLDQVQDGDGPALDFESFFQSHRPAPIAFLRRRTKNEADAEEISQESYLRVLRYGYGDSRPAGVWRALLYRIASNLAISHLRTRAAQHTDMHQDWDALELPSDEPSLERRVTAQQELVRVREALLSLPPKCRKVFLLSRAHHKSYPQIAQLCGISVKMVEKYMSTALGCLRHAVAPEVDE